MESLIGTVRAADFLQLSDIRKEVELVEHREGEGGADDDAQYHQQCVQYPGRRLCRPALVTADIFAEEDVECRHDAACQEVVLGDAEEVDLREPDQRPVAEEHGQHDVDPLRKGQHQPDGEYGDRTRHHGRGDHRERTPQRQRKERVDERHGEQQQREACMVVRALERSVFHDQVVYPDTPHDRPEERQHVVVLALFAV